MIYFIDGGAGSAVIFFGGLASILSGWAAYILTNAAIKFVGKIIFDRNKSGQADADSN